MSRTVLIAHVPYEHRGGEDVHVEALARAYGEIGWRPVFYPQSRAPEKHGLAPSLASLLPGHVPAEFLEVWRAEKPSFIHLHNVFPSLGPGFFGWAMSEEVTLVMTVHNHRFFCANGLALRDGKICKDCFGARVGWRPLLRNCNQSVVKSGYHSLAITRMGMGDLYDRAVSRFIAPTRYTEQELVRWGTPPSKIYSLPNPVVVGEGDASRPREFDVFFAGRISPEKGIGFLLSLFGGELKDLKLGIAGSGEGAAQVIEAARISRNITYLGALPREEVHRSIDTAGIGIVASMCNELPTFVMECFARGKRCLMLDQESVRWLEDPDLFGSFGRIASRARFADAVRETLALPAPREGEAREFRERFGMKAFCEGLATLISSLPLRP